MKQELEAIMLLHNERGDFSVNETNNGLEVGSPFFKMHAINDLVEYLKLLNGARIRVIYYFVASNDHVFLVIKPV